MKDATGLMLREAWKARGTPHCAHPELSPEESFAGARTDHYLCRTCGARIEMNLLVKNTLPHTPSSSRDKEDL